LFDHTYSLIEVRLTADTAWLISKTELSLGVPEHKRAINDFQEIRS
jgi:hypothetical protein